MDEGLPICVFVYHTFLRNRYHGLTDNPYFFPSDDREAARLDTMHDIFRLLFNGKNVLVPIKDVPGTKILDLGAGSGSTLVNNPLITDRELGDSSRRRIRFRQCSWYGFGS
jgi:hypothetical protein